MQFCFVFSRIALMAAPVNHLGEAKSFDSLVSLEWRHLEMCQRSFRFSQQPINPAAPSSDDYLWRFFAPTQAGALRLPLTGIGPLQEFIRGPLRLLASCSSFTNADECLTRTASEATTAPSILTFNRAPLVPILSLGQFCCFCGDG